MKFLPATTPCFLNTAFASNISRFLILAVVIGIGVSSATAATINFTTAEGYSSTNQALNGQPISSPAWDAHASYSVNGTTGIVTSDRGYTSSNLAAVYQGSVGAGVGKTLEISLDFQFASVGSANSTSNRFFGTIDLAVLSSQAAATAANDNAKLILYRAANSADYRIYFASEINTFNSSTPFTLASIGDNGTVGDLTDPLRMTLTMTKGVTSTDWLVTASLVNMTTGTTVASLNLSGMGTSAAFYNSSTLYGGFHSGTAYGSGSGIGTSAWSATQFSVIPEPSSLLLGAAGLAFVALSRRRKN